MWIQGAENPLALALLHDLPVERKEPQEGSQHFRMDANSGGEVRNELTLTVDLKNEEFVELVWWAKEFSDERHIVPGPFIHHGDFDGVGDVVRTLDLR